jgi:hypothetical protein
MVVVDEAGNVFQLSTLMLLHQETDFHNMAAIKVSANLREAED